MTIDCDVLREGLRAWTRSPATELPEYWADPIVQRRVGTMLASVRAKSPAKARRKLVVKSIQIISPDKS